MTTNGSTTSRVQEVAISLPLSINSFGAFSTTTDQSQIYADRVRTVISTAIGERVMRPDFGNAIPNRVYNSVGSMRESVDTLITEAFSSHLPNLELVSVNVLTPQSANIFQVEVVYLLPDKTETSVIAGIATLSGDEPIEEVLI